MVARDITLSGLSFRNRSNTPPKSMGAPSPWLGQVPARGRLMIGMRHREWPGHMPPKLLGAVRGCRRSRAFSNGTCLLLNLGNRFTRHLGPPHVEVVVHAGDEGREL